MDNAKLSADIAAFMKEHELDYDSRIRTQEQWRERGEQWGNNASLVITQEGGGLVGQLCGSYYFGRETTDLVDAFNAFLEARGVYWEAITHWAMGIYPKSGAEQDEDLRKPRAPGYVEEIDKVTRDLHAGVITLEVFLQRYRRIWSAIREDSKETINAVAAILRARIRE